LELVLQRIILSSDKSDLLLTDLVEKVSQPSDKVVEALENLIIHRKIDGQINIRELKLLTEISKSGAGCAICKTKEGGILKYQCTSCNSIICGNCYSEMELVGMISCPECGDKLKNRL
jgi:hypothetical protein